MKEPLVTFTTINYILDILDILDILIWAYFIAEIIALLLKKLALRKNKRKIKIWIGLTSRLLSLLAILTLLTIPIYISTTFISSASSEANPEKFKEVLFAFIFLWTLSFLFVHVLGYCFSGLLHKYPIGGKFWPKGIDYFYYTIGSLLLLLILGEIYQQKNFVANGIKFEIIVGVYLFNLKIFKTSYDIFPNVFKSDNTLIRDPFFGKIL